MELQDKNREAMQQNFSNLVRKRKQEEQWKWETVIHNMSIIVFGDKDEPCQDYLKMAEEKLSQLDTYVKIGEERIHSWFYKPIKSRCIAVEFGQFYYEGTRIWEDGFSITLINQGDTNDNWLYTVKFKKDGWPVGCEVWSRERCNLLNEQNLYMQEEDFERISSDKDISQELVTYLTKFLNTKYPVCCELEENTIFTNYVGTRLIEGSILMTTLGEETGEMLIDVYSNYGVKFIKKYTFIPISVEFYIS